MAAHGSPGRRAGSWTSGASGARDWAIVWSAGSSSNSTLTRAAASSAASWVSAATAATGSPWYLVSPVAEHGAVAALRTEAGHRVGQVGRGRHEADAGDLERGGGVDPADPRARHVERDELHVEDVVVRQVGDVLLLPGDAGTAADARGGLPDAHCGATFASGTADRSPTAGVGCVVSWASPRAASRTASMICS